MVGNLSTTDVDDSDTHTYAVSDARFEVVDGQLKLKDGVSLDHEAGDTVSLDVTTTDAGGLSYTETFSISVGDVNEVASDIALDNTSVAENAAGAVVGNADELDAAGFESVRIVASDAGNGWTWPGDATSNPRDAPSLRCSGGGVRPRR